MGNTKFDTKRKAEADAREKFEYDKAYGDEMQRLGGDQAPSDAEATVESVAEGVSGVVESPVKFKLGGKIPGIAHGGRVTKKHKFSVERKKLEEGVLGEAHPGRVIVDESVEPGSTQEKKVISHEGQHVKDMDSGKAAFGDDWVRWDGKTYPRKDGKIKYNGTWDDEGSDKFPWEKSAMKAEK